MTQASVERHELPSPVKTAWAANNRVPFLYLAAAVRGGRAPGLLVCHGYGMSKDVILVAGRILRRHGYAVLLPDLPFHGERAWEGFRSAPLRIPGIGPGRVFPFGPDLEGYVTTMEQVVADIRLCLGWLADRPGVDPDRLGVGGFSLGGVVTCLVAGLEPRLRASVSLMGGGDFGAIIFESEMTADIREDLSAAGWTKEDVRRAFREVDPMTHAHRASNLLMLNGLKDQVIPPSVARAVADRLPAGRGNRVVWGPWSHLPPVVPTRHHVLEHLRRTMGPGAGEG